MFFCLKDVLYDPGSLQNSQEAGSTEPPVHDMREQHLKPEVLKVNT